MVYLQKHPFKNNFGRQFQNSNWPGPAPPPSGGVGGKMKVSKGQQQQQQQQMSMPPNMGPGPPPPNMPPDFNQMPGQGGPPPGPWNTQNSSVSLTVKALFMKSYFQIDV